MSVDAPAGAHGPPPAVAAFWKDSRVMDVGGDYTLEVENPEGLALAILDFCQATVSA